MENKKFKVILTDKSNNIIDIDYKLHDTLLSVKWFTKIKHLHKIQIDAVISELEDVSNLELIYEEFCKFARLPKIPLPQKIDQPTCNFLHQIYEENHDRFAGKKNSEIMYRFHHAIHNAERGHKSKTKLYVGWGVKEGPLTQIMNCHPFYEQSIIQNNIYLPWAELGKTPYRYWEDVEPNDVGRFNALSIPHRKFRAMFFIALNDRNCLPFPNQFNQYFNQFKQNWLSHWGIDDWTERDEWCAPLLAYTDTHIDMRDLRFKKIVI